MRSYRDLIVLAQIIKNRDNTYRGMLYLYVNKRQKYRDMSFQS